MLAKERLLEIRLVGVGFVEIAARFGSLIAQSGDEGVRQEGFLFGFCGAVSEGVGDGGGWEGE